MEAGFTVEKICEPPSPEEWKTTQPDRYDGFMETPVYMIIKMRKH